MTRMPNPQYVPDAISFLAAHFEIAFWLDDPAGETIAMRTRDISAAELRAALETYEDAIRGRLLRDARRRLCIFVGGPLNGQPHGRGIYVGAGTAIVRNLGRAKWASYCVGGDNCRAFFCGEASSERKARQLAWKVGAPT